MCGDGDKDDLGRRAKPYARNLYPKATLTFALVLIVVLGICLVATVYLSFKVNIFLAPVGGLLTYLAVVAVCYLARKYDI